LSQKNVSGTSSIQYGTMADGNMPTQTTSINYKSLTTLGNLQQYCSYHQPKPNEHWAYA